MRHVRVVAAGIILLVGFAAAPLAQEATEATRQVVALAVTLNGVVSAEGVASGPNSRFLFLYGGPECTDKDGGSELFKRLQTLARVEGLQGNLFARECHRVVVPRRHETPGGVHQVLTLGLKHTPRGDAVAELQQLADVAEALDDVHDAEIWDAGGAGLVLTLRRSGECGDSAEEAALRDAITAQVTLARLDVNLFPRQCYLVLVPPPGPVMMQPGALWIGSETLGVWESDAKS